MSQILDAINKAEQRRQEITQLETREDLYQSLKLQSEKPKRSLALPLGVVFFILTAGAVHTANQNGWFSLKKVFHFSGLSRQSDNNIRSSKELAQDSHPTADSTIVSQKPRVSSTSKPVNTVEKQMAKQYQSANTKDQTIPKKSLKNETTIKKSSTISETIKSTQKEKIKNSKVSANKTQIVSAKDKNKSANIKSQKKLAILTPVAEKKSPAKKLTVLKPIKPRQNKQTITKKNANKSAVVKNRNQHSNTSVSRETLRPNNVKTAKINEMSASAHDTKPIASWKKNIHITAIVYHNNPSKRFVLIKGAKIYEGGIIPKSNTTVVKILPQSIIIDDGSGSMLIR